MKPVYKCDYCNFMGTEEQVKEHEPTCIDNYDKRSCNTCKHRDKFCFEDKILKYKCSKNIDIPAGMVYEFCESYERKPINITNNLTDVFGNLFMGKCL